MLLDDGNVRYPKKIRVFGMDISTGSDCARKLHTYDELECYVVEVEGEKAGKKTTYILSVPFPSLLEVQEKLLGATHESYVTGVSAAIFTGMICTGDIKTKGVFLPECLELEARETFLTKLSEKDIKIQERVETV